MPLQTYFSSACLPPYPAAAYLFLLRPLSPSEMSGSSFPTKLKVALAAQAVFALVLIFYVSQTLLRHLQFGVPQPIADYFVQLIAIIVPPAMLLLSFLALRSPRRAIQACIIAQLLVCLAAARFLVPEALNVARGEGVGWAGRLLIAGSAPVVLVSLTLAVVFCHYVAVTRHSRTF
jgi:hypothetical protein